MEINDFIPRGRLYFFFGVAALIVCLILFTYGSVMLKPRSDPALNPTVTERGAILDRNGRILAIQTTLYNVSITRSAVPDIPALANVLSPCLGMTPDEISAIITSAPRDFCYIKKKVSQGECDAVRDAATQYKLRGIGLEPIISRTYPENSLASQLIGFMGSAGEGLAGIEYSFDEQLSPHQGADGTYVSGNNVVLTVDSNLQYTLEQIGRKAMQDTQAESMMMLAADAKSGELLSYIAFPSANLNSYQTASEAEKTDKPAMYAYEPGSVFKVFSVASFLEMGGIQDTDTFLCDGEFSVQTTNGERVRITCLDRHGWVTARQALEFSCNDAIAQMSQKVSSDSFINMLRQFGFGSKTGIELPGETKGLLKNPTDKLWSGRSKPTIAMGQEVAVSALQMIEAATALANQGKRIDLSVVSKVIAPDGKLIYQHVPQIDEQPISPKTAELLLSYMETTARYGTGYRASINDVRMAVKTGTAQMPDPVTKGYSSTDFISNCLAIFPADNPQIILYIVIVKAHGETLAGRIVAPVIAEASNAIIDYLGLSRSTATTVQHSGVIEIPKNQPVELGSIVPDMTGIPKRLLTPLLNRQDISVLINGDGYVVSQNPPPGTPVTEGMSIELTLQ